MKSGFLLLDKPSGITSALALTLVKQRLKIKKIGHAGTLDPLASGLLVCLINEATKLADLIVSGEKKYSGVIKFGITTASDDITGEVLSTSASIPAQAEILALVTNFMGEIDQVPPQVSAVMVDGKRAYKLARAGRDFTLNSKKISIRTFSLSRISNDEYGFVIDCSPGTYIRSIARDLGSLAGCGACIKELRREDSFPYSVKDAKLIEDLSLSDIITWADVFPERNKIYVDAQAQWFLKVGNVARFGEYLAGKNAEPEDNNQDKFIYFDDEKKLPLGLLNFNNGQWKIERNLIEK